MGFSEGTQRFSFLTKDMGKHAPVRRVTLVATPVFELPSPSDSAIADRAQCTGCGRSEQSSGAPTLSC